VLPSSGDSFPHLIKKRGSQLGFLTYLLTYLRTYSLEQTDGIIKEKLKKLIYFSQSCAGFDKESQRPLNQ